MPRGLLPQALSQGALGNADTRPADLWYLVFSCRFWGDVDRENKEQKIHNTSLGHLVLL